MSEKESYSVQNVVESRQPRDGQVGAIDIITMSKYETELCTSISLNSSVSSQKL